MQKNKMSLNEIVDVQAYKHDGQLYRQWNGVKIIKMSEKYIILLLFKTKVQEFKGQKWIVHEPTLWWMSFNDFFNTTALIRKDGIYYYTNIASPLFFEEKTIKFIDYDLDIKDYPQLKTKLVDKKEFAENSRKLKYSTKLLKIIEKTLKQVTNYRNQKKYIFNEKNVYKILQKLIDDQYLPSKFLKDFNVKEEFNVKE